MDPGNSQPTGSRNQSSRPTQDRSGRLGRQARNGSDLEDGYENWRELYLERSTDRRPGPDGRYPRTLQTLFAYFNFDTRLLQDINWHCRYFENRGHPELFPRFRDRNQGHFMAPLRFEKEGFSHRLSHILSVLKFDQIGQIQVTDNKIIRLAMLIPLCYPWPADSKYWVTTANDISLWSKPKQFRYRSSPAPDAQILEETVPAIESIFPQWLDEGRPPYIKEKQRRFEKLRSLFKYKILHKSDQNVKQRTPPPRWEFLQQEDARLTRLAIDKQKIIEELAEIRESFKDRQIYADGCELSHSEIVRVLNEATEVADRYRNDPNVDRGHHYTYKAHQCKNVLESAKTVLEQARAAHEKAKKLLQALEDTYQQYELNDKYDKEAFMRKASDMVSVTMMRQFSMQLKHRSNVAQEHGETYEQMLERAKNMKPLES